MRRPIGDHGVGCGAEMLERGQHLFALGLQRVDAQIERRAARHRGRLRHAVVAEHGCQRRIQPFRIVAGDVRRRAVEGARGERRSLGLAQRLRRKTSAVAQRGDGLGRHAALEPAACRAPARAACPRPSARRSTPAAAARPRSGLISPRGRPSRHSDARCPTPSALLRPERVARRWSRSVRWLRTAGQRESFRAF